VAGIALTWLAVVVSLLAAAVGRVQDAAERVQCNLSGVALAFHNYQDQHGGLPPAAVRGKDGAPLLSWRVLLLPYLDQNDLYEEFRLDEPWDSPHNLALLPRMPKTYAPPGRKAALVPPHHTTLQVFVGPGTSFEEKRRQKTVERALSDKSYPFSEPRGLKIPDDFPDGTSNTLLFVEAGEPVPWTKPQDLPYDPDGPLPELRCLFRDGFRACMVDASRCFVRKGAPEAALRAAITRNGGEKADLDALR
jgi:hypothetical protein